MKRLILLLLTVFNIFFAFGQLTATPIGSYKSETNHQGIDYLFVFNGLDNATVKYNGSGNPNNMCWYKYYPNGWTEIMRGQNEFSDLKDMTGYVFKIKKIDGITDSLTISFWVIDYQNDYLPQNLSLVPENNPAEQCSEVKLFPQGYIPTLSYKIFNKLEGDPSIIQRTFNLSYNNIEWKDEEWKAKEEKRTIDIPKDLDSDDGSFTIPAPLVETVFTLSGDQFAEALGITPLPMVQSELYRPVAVECHILYTTSVREEKHEGDRPSDKKIATGSSPLEIYFEAKANEPVARFFNWQITLDGEPLLSRNDRDHPYTFRNAGIYRVILKASNQYCSSTDTLMVKVSASGLQVPYAFTPNGDGKNDEFRVAYTSLTDFKCWIFNRWGRQIYFWTDPQKGWDGTINGTPARPGGYVYIIEATGADLDEYTKKPIKYRKKGIVNLLR